MDHEPVVVTKPGMPPARLEKRTNDSKIFLLDCTPLLAPNELIFGNVTVNETALTVTQTEPKLGKYIKFRVSGGPTAVPYETYNVIFLVKTSLTSEISVPVAIKVYSA